MDNESAVDLGNSLATIRVGGVIVGLIIRLVILGLLVLFVIYVIRTFFGKNESLKCKTCRHCRKLFEDGSLCGFGQRETYKTIVHVENCVDYERR